MSELIYNNLRQKPHKTTAAKQICAKPRPIFLDVIHSTWSLELQNLRSLKNKLIEFEGFSGFATIFSKFANSEDPRSLSAT